MTICVYYNNVLAADGLSSYGTGDIKNTNIKKIGMVYQSLTTGERSLNADSLDYPVEFAMYGIAGTVNHIPKFLRWLISADHPGIDFEYDSDLEDGITDYDLEDSHIHTMVIFKNYDFVREYFSNYASHDYTESTKNNMSCVGSGTFAANAINKYDPQASAEDLIIGVSNVSTSCGGEISTLEFTDEAELLLQYQTEIDATNAENSPSSWNKFLNSFKRFFN